jgi:NhaP-type Na+/H+ or K+/H+ antiporter
MGTESFVLLFIVATAVAIGARRFRLSYTVALVLAGLGLGVVGLFAPPDLTKELLYAVFLPGLLFEAATSSFLISGASARPSLLWRCPAWRHRSR